MPGNQASGLAPSSDGRNMTRSGKSLSCSAMSQLPPVSPMVLPRPLATQNSVRVPKMSELASLRPPDSPS